jgi:hypothetical protein
MKNLICFILLGVLASCNSIAPKPQRSVADFECKNDTTVNITPQKVEKNPMKYRGNCFTWVGKVDDINEVEQGKIWVYEDIRDCDYTYFGQCAMSISFNIDGIFSGESFGYSDIRFSLDKFVYDGDTDEIFEDDIVKITATVVGEEVKDHPLFKDRYLRYIVFAVHEIEKL